MHYIYTILHYPFLILCAQNSSQIKKSSRQYLFLISLTLTKYLTAVFAVQSLVQRWYDSIGGLSDTDIYKARKRKVIYLDIRKSLRSILQYIKKNCPEQKKNYVSTILVPMYHAIGIFNISIVTIHGKYYINQ